MSSDRPDETFAALFEKTGAVPSRRPGARVGEVLDATVVQVGKDAVFVELPGQRQGLIEAIDLRAPDGTMNVAVGTRLRARVARSDAENGIRLVPTIDAAALVGASVSVGGRSEADAVKVAVGQVISGVVHRVELYGIFVQIDGTTGRAGRGLLPTVELGAPRGTDLRKACPLGMKIKAKVIEMTEGKIRLSVRALKDDEERASFDGFRETVKNVAPPTLGTFGDLLVRSQKVK